MNSLLLFVCVIFKFVSGLESFDGEIQEQCVQHCPMQNRNETNPYDYTCENECKIQECEKGCGLWMNALNLSSSSSIYTPCHQICIPSESITDRIHSNEVYCVIGCNDAVTRYFTRLRSRIGTPSAPALVAESVNSTFLKLEWKCPEGTISGLNIYVQWTYADKENAWQYSRNVTWNRERTMALVENLQPYTRYKFRVALTPAHYGGEQIISAPSLDIGTKPSGVPASSPTTVRASAVDCTRISVSWEPGPFPHGPLLSYVLQITDNKQIHTEVKDMSPDVNHYLFRNLLPQTEYNLTVSMRNSIGLGPSANITVSTPPEPILSNTTKRPILILGTEHSVIEQGTYILDEPTVLYQTERSIRGVAVHISKRLLFVSESDGHVVKMSLADKTISYILSPQEINFVPLDLSIDWLNNLLYILGEVGDDQKMWQIARCTLNGDSLTVAVAGLVIRPHSMEVDPYNGYLFWAVSGPSKGGLYRLDLSDISNGIKHEVRPEIILKDPNLGAFTLDHTNFSVLVSRQKENTIHSVSLDGKEIYNLRPKIVKSKMYKVISLATANKKFFWTDGDNVFYEEYKEKFFHNSYPDLSARSYKKVIVNLESSQPIPIPVNPPRNVQAIFGNDVGRTTWLPPHLLGGQGKGAWQNWSYEVSFKDAITNTVLTAKVINSTACGIENLKENTKYIIKAAAYTEYGKGPWSKEFVGRTLQKKIEQPFVLWAAAEGLLKSDATGRSAKTLIHANDMRNFSVTDVALYKDTIYLVTNNSQMIWYNLRSYRQGKLLDSVGSIAVDWLGKKLYWSNLKQQMIIRGDLNGTQQEPLSILTLAKELNIDSIKAYIYWSNGFAVECAHLNGMGRKDYHRSQLFSGKQVMGLTLDMDHKYVYWIVRGSEGSNLFKAPMAGYADSSNIIVEKVASLQNPNMQGSLYYFHNRLLWLQDSKNAAFSDLEGNNIAIMPGTTMSELTMVYVVDPSQFVLPESLRTTNEIVVLPKMIDRNSIKVIGSSGAFNISWDPSDNVNYGTVFYEIQIGSLSRNDSTITTTYPSVKYWQNVTPYTKLNVVIRAYTYWGTSSLVRVMIFSPPSTPSAPRNLRSFVNYEDNSSHETDFVSITFRWDLPLYANGIIEGFKVYCWFYRNDTKFDICRNVIVKGAQEYEHVATDLAKDIMYYFEVRAFTNIGDGKLSETLGVNSNLECPVPKLLVASSDSIFVQDIDLNQNYSIIHGINTPTEIGYLIRDNNIFWINQMKELFMYNVVDSNRTKIHEVMGTPIGIAVDWLERIIYYVEMNENSTYSIGKVDLNLFDRGVVRSLKIVTRPWEIFKLEVSPFTKKLYWVESEDQILNTLMESDTGGNNIRKFFTPYARSRRLVNSDLLNEECNCPLNPSLEKYFALDHSHLDLKPLVIFVDYNTQSIMSADKAACRCSIIANYTIVQNFIPIGKIKSDFQNVYWTSANNDALYALKMDENNVVSKQVKVLDMSIFGHHVQPYPPKECLIPNFKNESTVRLKRRTSNSLILKMPKIDPIENCSEISMATVEYLVCYVEHGKEGGRACSGGEDDTQAKRRTTFDLETKIEGLKPFTEYKIWVSVRNHYSSERSLIVMGSPVVFRTAPGAPSKPLIVSAVVLNPVLAKVSWLPPSELNGEFVYYEIHWQTEATRSGLRKKEELPVFEHRPVENMTIHRTALLHKLSPNESYTVWVRAYCETNKSSSDSDRIKIITYPEPNNLTLVNKTSTTMRLLWPVSRHVRYCKAQYTQLMSREWSEVQNQTNSDEMVIFHVDDLKPKTLYKFRLSLTYDRYSEEYVWPTDSRFTFETLGDRPSPPGMPIIQYFKPNVYKVWWEASKNNGASITLYKLEGLVLKHYRNKRNTNRTAAFFYSAPSVEIEEREWKEFYNGTETSWVINGLSEEYKYVFRVLALNSYGWSTPSKESTEFDLNEAARMADKQSAMKALVYITCTLAVVGVFVLATIVFCVYRCPRKKKDPEVITMSRGPDVELATLRELPRRGQHNTNILYIPTTPTPEEIKLLPHIKREQITLTNFLGRGAFGEVFEGKARDIANVKGDVKVAIKTLRKGASDQEKTEFLQEAQLMSHFKHEHILELLGVCLDNDPHFIIMELMEGGDLLTYLRSSRNLTTNTQSLTLIDLLKMCEDVSKGCRYLEEKHFVHRDLACRNCLVSSINSANRIVKIGDFGLARDIYKNDYYRKEGEGLLPVRWMAPESLVDGVFTSQSDVWAFGVLLWEIMTMGQQPYPARTNLEVLHYVRSGGRLGKPIDCPVQLHSLMLQCWEFEQEKRPSFQYCLEVLTMTHKFYLKNPATGVHEGQYISTVPDPVSSWKSDNEEETREKTPFLKKAEIMETSTNIPKYLELVYDANSSIENDGYEIPNQMLDQIASPDCINNNSLITEKN